MCSVAAFYKAMRIICPPFVPEGYLFTDENIKDFLLTKGMILKNVMFIRTNWLIAYNLYIEMQHVSPFDVMFTKPRQALIDDLQAYQM